MLSGSMSNDYNDREKTGYRFISTPELNGMKVSNCSGTERTIMEYDFDLNLDKTWLQPVVQIDVDATGFRGIKINRIYKHEDTLTNDSNLLSFEKANEIAVNMYSDSYKESINIGDIRLEYIIIQYHNETVMAPAWVYYETDGTGAKFAVNATDGSIVHFSFNPMTRIRWIQ